MRWSGIKIVIGNRQPIQFKKRQLVEVPFLMDYLPILELEKTTTFETQGVSPLEDSGITALVNTLLDANHFCPAEIKLQ